LRNLRANIGAFHLNLWLHTLVEVWTWDRSPRRLIDRAGSPRYNADRRPSHADRRRALQCESPRVEYQATARWPRPKTQMLAAHAPTTSDGYVSVRKSRKLQ
jgi:hypothetical protein